MQSDETMTSYLSLEPKPFCQYLQSYKATTTKSFINYTGSFWAALVAQLVKNLPAMQETLAWFLGQEDPLEKG